MNNIRPMYTENNFAMVSEKDENRIRNLWEITDGFYPPICREEVKQLCLKRVPCLTHSTNGALVQNIIRAYDRIVVEIENHRASYITLEDFVQLTLEFSPELNRTYSFDAEERIWQQCQSLMYSYGNRPAPFIKSYRVADSYRYNSAIITAALLLSFKECLLRFPELTHSDLALFFRLTKRSYDTPNKIHDKMHLLLPAPTMDSSETAEHIESKFDWLRHLAGGQQYSCKELMEKTGEKNRKSFAKDFLTPALDNGFVEKTETNPNSPKQKYRLTDAGRVHVAALKTEQ